MSIVKEKLSNVSSLSLSQYMTPTTDRTGRPLYKRVVSSLGSLISFTLNLPVWGVHCSVCTKWCHQLGELNKESSQSYAATEGQEFHSQTFATTDYHGVCFFAMLGNPIDFQKLPHNQVDQPASGGKPLYKNCPCRCGTLVCTRAQSTVLQCQSQVHSLKLPLLVFPNKHQN